MRLRLNAVLFLFTLLFFCNNFKILAANNEKELKWPDIENIKLIGARRASLETKFIDGKMQFVLRLEDCPKDLNKNFDVQLQFVEKEYDFCIPSCHIGFDSYQNNRYFVEDPSNGKRTTRNLVCRSSIEIFDSTYETITKSREWQIGIAERAFSLTGPESDRYYGHTIVYKPREWYGEEAQFVPKTVDVKQIRICQDPVWYKGQDGQPSPYSEIQHPLHR